jgi:hypothetical protein
MSNSFAFTAFIMASSPGRLSLPLAPLMPASSADFATLSFLRRSAEA